MEIRRSFHLMAPRDQVWEVITSPRILELCLPGCEEARRDGGAYSARMALKVGLLRIPLAVQVITVEEQPPAYAAFVTRGAGTRTPGQLHAHSTLALAALDAHRTEVTYGSRLRLSGPLERLAGRLLGRHAERMGDQFVAALRRELASTATARPG